MAKVSNFFETTDLAKEYINFEGFLTETDRVLFFDIVLYYLMIMVLVNVLFAWLPNHFARILFVINKFVSGRVATLFLISLLIMIIFALFGQVLNGAYLYRFYSIFYVLLRNLFSLLGGFFLQSEVLAFSLGENLSTLSDYLSLFIMILESAAFNFVFQFLFFNLFIAIVLNYMKDLRSSVEEKNQLLKEKEDQLIEREIRRDKQKAIEEEERKRKFRY